MAPATNLATSPDSSGGIIEPAVGGFVVSTTVTSDVLGPEEPFSKATASVFPGSSPST